MKYRFFRDRGPNGWLEVPMLELVELGIAERVSCYSRMSRDGQLAYLEEDCDAALFFVAKGWRWDTAPFENCYQGDSRIGGLPAFLSPRRQEELEQQISQVVGLAQAVGL